MSDTFADIQRKNELEHARMQGFIGGFLTFAAFVGKFYGATLPDKYLNLAADNEYRKWVKELEAGQDSGSST